MFPTPMPVHHLSQHYYHQAKPFCKKRQSMPGCFVFEKFLYKYSLSDYYPYYLLYLEVSEQGLYTQKIIQVNQHKNKRHN